MIFYYKRLLLKFLVSPTAIIYFYQEKLINLPLRMQLLVDIHNPQGCRVITHSFIHHTGTKSSRTLQKKYFSWLQSLSNFFSFFLKKNGSCWESEITEEKGDYVRMKVTYVCTGDAQKRSRYIFQVEFIGRMRSAGWALLGHSRDYSYSRINYIFGK